MKPCLGPLTHRAVRLAPFVALLAASQLIAQSRTSQPPVCARMNSRQCYAHALALAVDSADTARSRGDMHAHSAFRALAASLLDGLCDAGAGYACFAAGRLALSADVLSPARDTLVAEYYRRGCAVTERSGNACAELGAAYERGIGKPIVKDSAALYSQLGCQLGNPTACVRATYINSEFGAWGLPASAERQRTTIREACVAGSPYACVNTSEDRLRTFGLLNQPRFDPASAAADSIRSAAAGACSGGFSPACDNLAWWWWLASSPDSALRYSRVACAGVAMRTRSGVVLPPSADAWGCGQVAWHYVNGIGVGANRDTALVYSARACALLAMDACVDFANFRPDSSASARIVQLMTACYSGSGYGCLSAAQRFELLGDDESERGFYQRACNLANVYGCRMLGAIATDDGDADRAVKFLRRACDLVDAWSCLRLADVLMRLGVERPRYSRYSARACNALQIESIGAESQRQVGTQDVADACWAAMQFSRDEGDEVEEARFRTRACVLSVVYCKRKK